MALPAPVHVNQFSAGGRYPNGKDSTGHDCMVSVGAMALDAYTGGARRMSNTAFRALQGDQDGGIGLPDVADAWAVLGLRFDQGRKSWATVSARLQAGDGVALAGVAAALGRSRADSYLGPHGIYAQRYASSGKDDRLVIVNDPLRSGPVAIPEAAVKRFWASYLGLAGWGAGTAPPLGQTVATGSVTVPVRPLFLQVFNGGRGFDPGKPLTPLMVNEWALFILEHRGTGGAGPLGIPFFDTGDTGDLRQHNDATQAALVAALTPYVGQAVGQLPERITVAGVPALLRNPLEQLGDQLAAFMGQGLRSAVFLAAILALVVLGLYLTVRGDAK